MFTTLSKFQCPLYLRNIIFITTIVPLGFLTACADLRVDDVSYGPFTGPNLAMKAKIMNQGYKNAGASITSLQRRYNFTDPFVDTARANTPPIAKGDETVVPIWIFPPTELPQPGSCMHVRVCADADNDVDETALGVSRENNNCLNKSFMNRRYCRSCDLCCTQTLPNTFTWQNWQGVNWVSPVKDQQMCGSCWAFSAVAAVEAKHNVEGTAANINHIDLSEEELVACPNGGGSCLGGWPSTAFNYIRDEHVLEENSLQYRSTNCIVWDNPNNRYVCTALCTLPGVPGCANPPLPAAQCAALHPAGTTPWRIAESHWIGSTAIDDVKRALLCHGPLSVTSNNWAHAILLVGWDNNGWIIKNSWGTGWGNNGYGNIPFTGDEHSDIKDNAYYVQNVRQ
jgi:C1A family cysteine protease